MKKQSTNLIFYCLAFFLCASCGGEDNAPTLPIQDTTAPTLSIATPIALDDLIIQAESTVIKIFGTSDAENGQIVNVNFSDGTSNVNISGTINLGEWVTSKGNLSSLNDGNLTITATVEDQAGNQTEVQIDNIPLDKTILPPSPQLDGTIFTNPDIITDQDQSALQSVTANGSGTRTMFDRRVNDWTTVKALLFDATYLEGKTIEVQVNPEFTSQEALKEAQKYALEIGRLPRVLRQDAETLWIHKGVESFGGGNNNFLIHTGNAETIYIPARILSETFVHEGTHTSLDSHFKDDPNWLYAQEADGTFISTYARDNPEREDIAETFLYYLAYKYRPDALTTEQKERIKLAMSYRMAYFDKQDLDMSPFN